jgi:phytanoyl-CoA hydroxylase
MNVEHIAASFHEEGFALARQVFSANEVDRMKRNIEDYIHRITPGLGSGDVYYEDSPAKPVKSLFRMHQRSEFFANLMHDHRLLEIMRAIWPKGEIVAEGVMFFGKPASDGAEYPAHQDNTFQCWDPPMALTATIAVDESTSENGVLVVQRGSHRVGLLPHRQTGIMGLSRCLISPVSTIEYPEVQLCMKPGDVAVHHVETVHRSGPNRTDRSRRQLGLGYRSSLAKPNEQAKAQYHKDLQTLHAATK